MKTNTLVVCLILALGAVSASAQVPTLKCITADQVVFLGSYANFIATGGDGYYMWSAPGGTPNAIVGQNVLIQYNNVDKFTATVTSAGQTAICIARAVPAIQPYPKISSLLNAASFRQSYLVPGALVSLFGSTLSLETGLATGYPLPTFLGGTTVLVNGTPVPLLYVSAGQINFQVPSGLKIGPAYSIQVTNYWLSQTITGNVLLVPSAEWSVGMFSQNGKIIVQDPQTGELYSCGDHPIPVKNGAYTFTLYASALGQVVKLPADGTPASGLNPIKDNSVIFTLGDFETTILYAGFAPGFVGLYQINVTVPASSLPNYAASGYGHDKFQGLIQAGYTYDEPFDICFVR